MLVPLLREVIGDGEASELFEALLVTYAQYPTLRNVLAMPFTNLLVQNSRLRAHAVGRGLLDDVREYLAAVTRDDGELECGASLKLLTVLVVQNGRALDAVETNGTISLLVALVLAAATSGRGVPGATNGGADGDLASLGRMLAALSPSVLATSLRALEALFHCTARWGPTEVGTSRAGDAERLACGALRPLVRAALTTRGVPLELRRQLALVLLNAPAATTDWLLGDDGGDADETGAVDAVARVRPAVEGLVATIDETLDTSESEALLLLMAAARAVSEPRATRAAMRAYVFPPERFDDVVAGVNTPAAASADHVSGKLIARMTGATTALTYYTNELLFALAGERADEFTRLTGFGNAAGLMAMRGMMGVDESLKQASNKDTRAWKEILEQAKAAETATTNEDRSERPSAREQAQPAGDGDEDTVRFMKQYSAPPMVGESAEAYDIRRGRALFELEKRGVIKVKRKSDAAVATATAPSSATACAVCSQASSFRCSRCQRVRYCSRACQKQHWPAHKRECRAPKKS